MLPWDEEIHGFASPAEYQRFVQFIEGQIADRAVSEVPANPRYSKGMLFGGRWFQNIETGAIWRLIAPDPPFYGLWEPVNANKL